MGQRVAGRAMDLGDVAEGERVLQVARRIRRPEGAPVEQLAQDPEAGREAGVRAGLLDRGMQHGQVGAETLQAQRTRHVERIEETSEIGQRKRGPRGRERIAGDQREALARRQLDIREYRA